MVDTIFKVFTSELFEMFRYLYNFKDCSHKNRDLYDILPNEYKVVIYTIRGIYYAKKEKYFKMKIDNQISENVKLVNTSSGLRIADIYLMLKKYDNQNLIKLLNYS